MALGALGRAQSEEKRENTIFFTKNTFLASLAFHGVDEYREALYMALEPSFEAFGAAEDAHRSHLPTNQSKVKSRITPRNT